MQAQLKARIKFEQQRVIQAYNRAERRVLARQGGFLRTMSRRRMRRRSRASRPGEGPTVRKGQLKAFLLFGVDVPRSSVVIGPKLLPGATGDTPEAMEHGKTLTRWVGRGESSRRQSVRYAKRGATVPALEGNAGKLPAFWDGAVR